MSGKVWSGALSSEEISDPGTTLYYADLQAEGQATTTQFLTKIAGRVTNVGNVTAKSVMVIGVLYDEAGQILDVDAARAMLAQIPPASNAPFELDLYHERGGVHFVLLATGFRAEKP